MTRPLISIAPTLNALNILENATGIVCRYTIRQSGAVVPLKYVVTYCVVFTETYFFRHFKYIYIFGILIVFILDQAKIRSLNTCEVDGKTYRMGERIYPENSCYECLCTPDYNNATSYADNSDCAKINCGIKSFFYYKTIDYSLKKNNQIKTF